MDAGSLPDRREMCRMEHVKHKADWSSLGRERQTQLLIDFGHHLDELPPTCERQVKEQRLRDWLGQRGIAYPGGG